MCCPLSNERVCAIKAKPPVVVGAVKLIQTILNENPIKGTIKPYDALHFDLNLVEKYGGYLPDEGVEMIASHHHHYDPILARFVAQHHNNYPKSHISCNAISSRPNRFHPYAQQTVIRSQLEDPYATSPFDSEAQAIVASLRHHHHHHQQQYISPMNPNGPYSVPSRPYYQQASAVTVQQHNRNHHHQFMRGSNVYTPNNVADRCRHVRPCLCMLLPMNHHHHPDILSAAPFFQLVENFNHPRSPGSFNGNSNNHNNNNSNSNSNSNNNSNSNSSSSSNTTADNNIINNNSNINNKKKC